MSKTQNKFSPEVQSRTVRMALEHQSDSPSHWVAVSSISLFDGDTRLIHHSDRGSQYVFIAYTQRLLDAGIEPPVGSVGDSYERLGGNHQRPVQGRGHSPEKIMEGHSRLSS